MELTCAVCGEKRELCQSIRFPGIQQPRLCKDCLMKSLTTKEIPIEDDFWIMQLFELKDFESLENLKKIS